MMDIQKLKHFLEEDPNRIKLLDIQTIGHTNELTPIKNVNIMVFDENDADEFKDLGGIIAGDELDKILQPILNKTL